MTNYFGVEGIIMFCSDLSVYGADGFGGPEHYFSEYL